MVHYFFQAALEETAEAAEQVVETVAAAPNNSGLIGQALEITLIGMVILFVSLLILWGVMELLVRLVKDGPKEEAEEAEAIETVEADDDEKLKAAAAAAAYVIAKK